MSNPYQSPSFDPKQFQDAPVAPQMQPGFGWVNQVRIVAVLNCVQGVLELFAGILMLGMAAFIPIAMRMEPNDANRPPPQFESLFLLVYVVMGAPLVLTGALRVYAGIQNFRFRSRTLGIVSLAAGCLSMFFCYCAPTSIALCVYGLIVLLNPAVKTAFDMASQGMDSNRILATFATYQMSPPGSDVAKQ